MEVNSRHRWYVKVLSVTGLSGVLASFLKDPFCTTSMLKSFVASSSNLLFAMFSFSQKNTLCVIAVWVLVNLG